MPYPISLNKYLIIDLDKDSIINELTDGLNRIRTQFKLHDDRLKLTWCTEFSSGTSSLKEFNKGQIKLVSTNGQIRVHFKIVLIEHLVIFLFLLTLGVYGLLNSGLDSVIFKIAVILLTANFVFCYLFPLMALNSFIDDIKKRTNAKAIG
jgi:hypothetical protein